MKLTSLKEFNTIFLSFFIGIYGFLGHCDENIRFLLKEIVGLR